MNNEQQQTKKEEGMKQGPPKFTSKKSKAGTQSSKSSKSDVSEPIQQFESVSNKSARKISKTKVEKEVPSKQDKASRSSITEEEDKVPATQAKNWVENTEEQKHANFGAHHIVEEEKKQEEVSPFERWTQPTASSMPQTQQNHSMGSATHANPQCGYNASYQNMYPAEAQSFLYEKYIYQKLSEKIEGETEQITILVNMMQKYRQDIKEELEKIAITSFQSCHKNVEAHIYGSVATKLALPESDMDIMITGVNSFGNKETHRSNISQVCDLIQTTFSDKVLVSANKILNTQVPIIKLKFNLAEYFEERKDISDKKLPYVNFDSIDSINPHLKELSVDISVSDSFDETAHLGLLQSNFVREKLEEYPILRPVCLMLKKLLVENNFNDPYTGGLGSFSLFIMLYAALLFDQMNNHELFYGEATAKGRLYAWFLSLYGESFDIEKKVIFFLEDGTPMVFDKLGRSPYGTNKILCVYDPTNSKNNTTQKAFRIEDIQLLFKATKSRLTQEITAM